MAERPILFSGPMVKAILAGRKTQTRRVMKPQPYQNGIKVATGVEPDGIDGTPYPKGEIVCHCDYYPPSATLWKGGMLGADAGEIEFNPYGVPGDRLWVRETWRSQTRDIVAYKADGQAGAWMGDGGGGRIWIRHGWLIGYTAPDQGGQWMGEKKYGDRWRPSIHMPRDYSRLTLEITDVRVQRLQEITEEDAAEEECPGVHNSERDLDGQDQFARLWNEINGERAPWASNPWVWAISFRRVISEGV